MYKRLDPESLSAMGCCRARRCLGDQWEKETRVQREKRTTLFAVQAGATILGEAERQGAENNNDQNARVVSITSCRVMSYAWKITTTDKKAVSDGVAFWSVFVSRSRLFLVECRELLLELKAERE